MPGWSALKVGFGSAVVTTAAGMFLVNSRDSDSRGFMQTTTASGNGEDQAKRGYAKQKETAPGEPNNVRRLSAYRDEFCDVKKYEYVENLNNSIAKAQDICERVKNENGLPGLVISVTVNGKLIWEKGLGFADLENQVPMTTKAVFRIASISKSMTVAMLAKLMEDGKIDLDMPIQTYVPDYPKMQHENKIVTITTRHLLSHLSGIRHYLKKGEKKEDEMDCKEYFLKDRFNSVNEALELFKNDELLNSPGTKYLYSSHGFTVISKIIENVTGVPFAKYAERMFNFWGLKNTYLDFHENIIYNRSSYYSKDKKGRLKNSPYVDNSYKWAGGGFLSNVHDLTQFADMLIYSAQHSNVGKNEGNTFEGAAYLKQETLRQLWTGDARTSKEETNFLYGLGFSVEKPFRKCIFCKESNLLTVGHSGGAIGASSILFMRLPNNNQIASVEDDAIFGSTSEYKIRGLVIVMITNLTDVQLSKAAYEISDLFQWLI